MSQIQTSTETARVFCAENLSKPVRFAWLALGAFACLILGVLAQFFRHSAGPGDWSMVEAITFAVLNATVLSVYGWALMIWLGAVKGVCRRGRCFRWRTWISVAPPLFFLLFQLGAIACDPPSPKKLFVAAFGVELPGGLHVVEVWHSPLADPGFVYFALTGSEQSAQELIARMNLDSFTDEPENPLEHFHVGNDWKWREWRTRHQYSKTLRSGTGHILVADETMKRVLVCRNPLFAKSAEEYPEGHYVD